MRERAERKTLIKEVKDLILSGTSGNMKNYKKLGLSSLEEAIQLFINIGNMTFNSGDIEIFSFFIDALFEILGQIDDYTIKKGLFEKLQSYGNRAIHSHDVDIFERILNTFGKSLRKYKDVNSLNNQLKILKSWTKRSVASIFHEGLIELVDLYTKLDEQFKSDKLEVNRVYLKNAVITLVGQVVAKGDQALRDSLFTQTRDMLGFKPVLNSS